MRADPEVKRVDFVLSEVRTNFEFKFKFHVLMKDPLYAAPALSDKRAAV